MSSDDDSLGDSDEDAQFGTIARGQKGDARGLRQGGTSGLGLSGARRKQDDDDFDFDL